MIAGKVKMKKILFWICGAKGCIGELTHTRLFCEQLPPDEYEFYLWGMENLIDYHKIYLKDLPIKVISTEDILNIKFDIIALSEYYFFVAFNLNKIYSQKEKSAYYYLLNLNVPVLVFDMVGVYGVYGKYKNLYENTLKKEDKEYEDCMINKLCIKKEFEQCQNSCKPPNISIIYPSPPYCGEVLSPNMYLQNNTENVYSISCPSYYWRLPFSQITEEERVNKKKELLLQLEPDKTYNNPDDAKIIFLSISGGEYRLLKENRQTLYFFLLEKLLIHYLQQSSEKIYLIIISTVSFYYSINLKNLYMKNLLITNEEPLNIKDYENLFLASDLILSVNIIQNTFWRAICNGIPGINLSFNLPKKGSIDYLLTSFTKEVLEIILNTTTFLGHPINGDKWYPQRIGFDSMPVYKDLFQTCEILDEHKIIDLIDKCFHDKKFKQKFLKQKDKYMKKLSNLPDALDIVKSL